MTISTKRGNNMAKATSRKVAEASASTTSQPTHDQIAQRAYDIYIKKGCQPGHCQQNWHQAEHDLRHHDHTMAGAGGLAHISKE